MKKGSIVVALAACALLVGCTQAEKDLKNTGSAAKSAFQNTLTGKLLYELRAVEVVPAPPQQSISVAPQKQTLEK